MEFIAKSKDSESWAFLVEPDGNVLLTTNETRARVFDGRWRPFFKDFKIIKVPSRRNYSNIPLTLLLACNGGVVRLELKASLLAVETGDETKGIVAVKLSGDDLKKIGGLGELRGKDHRGD